MGATIRFEPAECVASCDIADCHYSHKDAWFVDFDGYSYGPFRSKGLAQATKSRLDNVRILDEREAEHLLTPRY